MNKPQSKTQSRSNIMLWVALTVVALIGTYGLWNAIVAVQTADKAMGLILEINTTDSRHKNAIIELQKCYNEKVATCTIDLQ